MRACIVTGDRRGHYSEWLPSILSATKDFDVILHGGARGVDTVVSMIYGDLPSPAVVPMFAQWKDEGNRAGILRNADMLNALIALGDTGYDIEVLAFHPDLYGTSRGTRDMVERAQRQRVKVSVHAG